MTAHRVLLTGANGFIASHILSQLLAASHSVRAVVRSQSKVDSVRELFPAASSQLDFAIVSHPHNSRAQNTLILYLFRSQISLHLEPLIKLFSQILPLMLFYTQLLHSSTRSQETHPTFLTQLSREPPKSSRASSELLKMSSESSSQAVLLR